MIVSCCYSLVESEAKLKAHSEEHAAIAAELTAKLEEAAKKSKDSALKADSNIFTLEILELRSEAP
jgi:hypothetical protein